MYRGFHLGYFIETAVMNFQLILFCFITDVYAHFGKYNNENKDNSTDNTDAKLAGWYASIASGSVLGTCFLITGMCACCRLCCTHIKTNVESRINPTSTENIQSTHSRPIIISTRSRTRPAFNLHRQLQESAVNTRIHTLSNRTGLVKETHKRQPEEETSTEEPPDYQTACVYPPPYSVQCGTDEADTGVETVNSPPPSYNDVINKMA